MYTRGAIASPVHERASVLQPIVGAREENLAAVGVQLSAEDLQRIDAKLPQAAGTATTAR